MGRSRLRPPSLLAAALVPLLCLAPPVQADPRADRIGDAAGPPAHAGPAQLDFFATAGTWFTTEFDAGDFDVGRFEASLPPDIPAPAARVAAQSVARALPPKRAASRSRSGKRASLPRVGPRAVGFDRGPRTLFIARVAPSDRDEPMPAQTPIPVTRASLPPPAPALALK
jgi:hypothetical protein